MKKTALITGASYGLGADFARIHAQRGGDLILVARSGDRLQLLKRELESAYGVSVRSIVADLSVPGSAERLYDTVGPCVDYLINNAGVGDFGPFAKGDTQTYTRMIHLNVVSLTQLTHLFVGDIARRKGKILQVGSVAGFLPGPYMAVYYATKAYVLRFSQALSYEMRHSGVSISVLCPGPTRTEFQKHSRMDHMRRLRLLPMADSYQIALVGYKGMLRAKRVIVPGMSNMLLQMLVRLLPSSVLVRMIGYMQQGDV